MYYYHGHTIFFSCRVHKSTLNWKCGAAKLKQKKIKNKIKYISRREWENFSENSEFIWKYNTTKFKRRIIKYYFAGSGKSVSRGKLFFYFVLLKHKQAIALLATTTRTKVKKNPPIRFHFHLATRHKNSRRKYIARISCVFLCMIKDKKI